MGAVFRPKDLGKGYKKVIENAIKDLSPETRDNVIELFDSWQDTSSVQKLKEILGPTKTEQVLKNILAEKGADLTNEERKTLKDILKDSLTFD
jgi:DNA-directed RNA polymerase subunit F